MKKLFLNLLLILADTSFSLYMRLADEETRREVFRLERELIREYE